MVTEETVTGKSGKRHAQIKEVQDIRVQVSFVTAEIGTGLITGYTFTGQRDNSRYTYMLVVTVETDTCQYGNSIDWDRSVW